MQIVAEMQGSVKRAASLLQLSVAHMRCRQLSSATGALLVRDFLQKSLYDPRTGYFTSKDVIIAPETPDPLPFNSMKGEFDYRKTVADLYAKNLGKWMTPVEIFAPYYSVALANYILTSRRSKELHLIEIGGGRGTNMLHLLDHIQAIRGDVYQRIQVTMVEISPRLAEYQQRTLAKHADKCTFLRCSAQEIAQHFEGSSSGKQDVFVLMMEVLDNMAHDKVAWDDRGHFRQATVEMDGDRMREVYQPLEDRHIRYFPEQSLLIPSKHSNAIARFVDKYIRRSGFDAAFVPTGAYLAFKALAECVPNHRIIACDFDYLPRGTPTKGSLPADGTLDAYNAPLVSGESVAPDHKGEAVDHFTYLVPLGSSDIFFPVYFPMLRRMYSQVCKRDLASVKVLKSREFLASHAPVKRVETRSGYNPLLEDFANTSFLLS